MTHVAGANKKILDSKSYLEVKQKLKINDNSEMVSYLLKQLTSIFNNNCNKLTNQKEIVIKMIDYLNQSIEESHNLDNVLIVDKIMNIKELLITKIKAIDKRKRNTSDVLLLRNTINKLEDLEVVLRYNLSGKFITTNSNIIKYILLKEKNLVLSESLIINYPYLINICEDNSGHILDILVDKYLESLNLYIKNPSLKKDLQYYHEVLRIVLCGSRVKLDDYIITKNKDKLYSIMLKSHAIGKEQLWLKHLHDMLHDVKHYNPSLATLNKLYDVSNGFSRMVDEECKYYLQQQVIEENADEFVITIDDEDVLARDDGVSIKRLDNGNKLLQVHISDVPKFVKPGNYLRRSAYKRTQTLYLPDQSIQMLPIELLKGKISLDQNKKRYVRTYCFEIDSLNNIIDFRIIKQVIKIARNLSFGEANHLLEHGGKDRQTDELFENLAIVPSILSNHLGITGNEIYKLTKSEVLVQSLMIGTSFKTAEYFKNNDYPMLYRSHDMQKDIPLYLQTRLDEVDDNNAKYTSCIKNVMGTCLASFYSVEPSSHEGLNLEQYTGITSPARRYGDIINCDCEDLFYFNRCDDEQFIDGYKQELNRVANYLNSRNEELRKYCEAYCRIRTKR